jgi:hypothetical protein
MTRRNSSEKPSRRSFAKSVAGSLIAVPFASSLASASQPQSEDTEPTAVDSVSSTTASPSVFKEHIPPLIIVEGSLEFEVAELDGGGSTPPYKYKFKQPYKHKGICHVVVLQMLETGDATKLYNEALTTPDGEVRIWLEKLGPSGYVPVDTSSNPQIVIKGGSETDPHPQIVTDKKLKVGDGRQNLPREENRRPKQIQHDGYGSSPFRIRQIQVEGAGSSQPFTLNQKRHKAHILIWFRSAEPGATHCGPYAAT